eukprot:TRINITY_DN37384_c0_g1_i1.p1 TRINITY_DN37384_c0_g1~~TRINITY_DN37384_c0_g1_i1.p1  ORF type:complete len:179 (-),score=41.23 TRINITY_DN37384_c0_g1_i1:47-544(-)
MVRRLHRGRPLLLLGPLLCAILAYTGCSQFVFLAAWLPASTSGRSPARVRLEAVGGDDFDFGDVPASKAQQPVIAKGMAGRKEEEYDEDAIEEEIRQRNEELDAGSVGAVGTLAAVLVLGAGFLGFQAYQQSQALSGGTSRVQKVQAAYDTFFDESESKTAAVAK